MADPNQPAFLARLLRALGRPVSTESLLARIRQSPRPAGPLTEAEFKRRLPVWIALADFFLDTDSYAFYVNTARLWHGSGFSRDELHSMLVNDVAPRFYVNLTVVAGVWDGFDDDTVELQMRRQMRRPKAIDWIYRADILEYLDKVWATLQPYLDAAEQGADLSTFVGPEITDTSNRRLS